MKKEMEDDLRTILGKYMNQEGIDFVIEVIQKERELGFLDGKAEGLNIAMEKMHKIVSRV
jgi:hypothetical protein